MLLAFIVVVIPVVSLLSNRDAEPVPPPTDEVAAWFSACLTDSLSCSGDFAFTADGPLLFLYGGPVMPGAIDRSWLQSNSEQQGRVLRVATPDHPAEYAAAACEFFGSC